MIAKITLTFQPAVDSTEELRQEIKVIEEITGFTGKSGEGRTSVYEGEFHEFYLRVKSRIMKKLEAYK